MRAFLASSRFTALLANLTLLVRTVKLILGGDPTRAYALAACLIGFAIYERMGEPR